MLLRQYRLFRALIVFSFIVWSAAGAAREGEQPLHALASIRPLALMVQDVAGDAVQVDVLLPAGASPHHYALRVSDMRRLNAADLLVWLGPEFERFLADVAASRNARHKLTLESLDGLSWPSLEAHAHETESDHADHSHSGKDMHLWLNPDNGRIVMRAVAARLSELLPAQAEVFARNLARAEAELDETMRQLGERLNGTRGRKFGASHDAFSHFVERFDLEQAAAVSTTAEQGLSARHVARTVAALEGAQCLIVEAGEADSSVRRLQQLVKLPIVRADPLALDPKVTSYANLIASVGASFTECLAKTAQ